jgi:hypothetical protein
MTIVINKNVDPQGLIKAGDVFTLRNDGFYRSNRLPSQCYSAEYVQAHLKGKDIEIVTSRGLTIKRKPAGWPNLISRGE